MDTATRSVNSLIAQLPHFIGLVIDAAADSLEVDLSHVSILALELTAATGSAELP